MLAFEPYHFDLATFFGDDAIEVRYLRFIMQQVLDGLRCLERLGIVHGDLRGSSIKLTTKDQVRVQVRVSQSVGRSSLNHTALSEPRRGKKFTDIL